MIPVPLSPVTSEEAEVPSPRTHTGRQAARVDWSDRYAPGSVSGSGPGDRAVSRTLCPSGDKDVKLLILQLIV